jgi:AbiV family abortive infection protein
MQVRGFENVGDAFLLENTKLTPAECLAGFSVCLENAQRLRDAAEQLAMNGFFAFATALALTRQEEIAKMKMLLEASKGKLPDGTWDQFWTDFRSHKGKDFHFKDASKTKSIPGWTEKQRDDALRGRDGAQHANPDRMRQTALYADIRIEGRSWRTPDSFAFEAQVWPMLAQGNSVIAELLAQL